MYKKSTLNRKRLRGQELKDPIKTKMPEKPQKAQVGTQGRIASIGLNQHIVKNIIHRKISAAHEDPREALLSWGGDIFILSIFFFFSFLTPHARLPTDKKAKADPMFFGRAYRDTQPVRILADMDSDDEDEVQKSVSNKRQK
jgi:hypothetical protein